jgi:hypothetical protein
MITNIWQNIERPAIRIFPVWREHGFGKKYIEVAIQVGW